MAGATTERDEAPRNEPGDALERQLVEQAARGDAKAFEAIYRRCADGAYRLLTRLIGPHADREDLLQDVFVRLHRALPSFRGDARLSTFVHTIAVRVAHDHLRRQGRKAEAATAELDVEHLRPVERSALERAAAYLGRLSPDQRIAFVLREVMELSFPEIAVLTGTKTATARKRHAVAGKAVARMVKRDGRPQ